MNPNKALQLLPQAFTLHQSGKFDEAASIYRKAMSADPKNADAPRMLGLLHLQQGQWQEGAKFTGLSLRLNPNQPEALNNQGYALQNLGRHEEALTCYDQALKLMPGYAGAWYNRGNLLQDMERHDEAISSYQQALAIRPDHADSWINLGKAFRQAERYDEALDSYRKAISLAPNNAVAYNNLGNTLSSLKRYGEAEANFNKAILLTPTYADAYLNLGLALQEQEKFDEALACYQKAVSLKPEEARAHLTLGKTYQELGNLDSALASYDQAIRLKHDYADAYAGKGNLLIELGKMQEATAILQQAVADMPDEIAPLAALLALKTNHDDEQLIARLESRYAQREALPHDDHISLDFSVGKTMEALGRYDDAFMAYEEGNRLHYQDNPFDEEADIRQLTSTLSYFSSELFSESASILEALPASEEKRVPIFIVGMPRSGTTLTEQILSSHPNLFGAGELGVMNSLARKVEIPPREAADWEDKIRELREFGRSYLDQVWQLAPEALYITDKLPHNFMHLGLIHLMLPNAKIIHVMRDPMDNCFSCYALRFKKSHQYCYDLEMLGRHYLRYKQYMQHWHNVLPEGRILDVRYEDTVADLEGQARRILEYVGLPWDPACLNFHENKRAVRTASVTQVRRPIYSNSVARWKRFEKHLGPLADIITAASDG